MVERITADQVVAAGWRAGTTLENRVAHRMMRWGYTTGDAKDPRAVVQQHRVGNYRLDFAWPMQRIALEADGWHHRSPEGAERDARRDAWLRSQGWLVFRVDDQDGEDGLNEQLSNALGAIHAIVRFRS